MNYQMYCIFSKEAIKLMGGNRGKMTSMAGHGFLHAYWSAEEKSWNNRYIEGGNKAGFYKNSQKAKKVTLFVETTEELISLYEELTDDKIGISLVTDSALTVFDGPTTVCFGYGPIETDQVPESIRKLKVLI